MKGKVYLVGAGPGDAELLTVKALRLLRTAEAVLHDDLVSPEILELVAPATRVYNVGKRCGEKNIRQEEINFLMIALAGSGMQVVRLKSGDPLIFGRAGEEIDALERAGMEYEIVPGVTSALGAAAGAGIALTHRQKSSALVLIAGHRASEKEADWNRLASSGATLVIYMPGHDYAEIANKLARAGVSRDVPCAIISRATTSAQQIHRTTVSQLPSAPHLSPPTLLIVGEVLKSAEDSVARSAASVFPASSLEVAFFESTFRSGGISGTRAHSTNKEGSI
jgi:uroporphyrin-III C-methyltransferase